MAYFSSPESPKMVGPASVGLDTTRSLRLGVARAMLPALVNPTYVGPVHQWTPRAGKGPKEKKKAKERSRQFSRAMRTMTVYGRTHNVCTERRCMTRKIQKARRIYSVKYSEM